MVHRLEIKGAINDGSCSTPHVRIASVLSCEALRQPVLHRTQPVETETSGKWTKLADYNICCSGERLNWKELAVGNNCNVVI